MPTFSEAERLAILDLHNQSFPDSTWDSNDFEVFFADKSLRPICTTIKSGDETIGLAIGRLSFNDISRLNLSALSVSRRHQGNGHGEDLVKKFFHAALDITSMEKIFLHFRNSNKSVKKFYDRFGFKNHTICGKYSDGEKKHYMDIDRRSIQKYLSKSRQ